MVALALERFDKLDILVNNAATIVYKGVVEMTLEEWERILAVNLTGVFLHSREAVRAMIPNKSGTIVNTGSYACFFGFPAIAAYCASKGGLSQLTRVLAVENIQHGIRVNAVGGRRRDELAQEVQGTESVRLRQGAGFHEGVTELAQENP